MSDETKVETTEAPAGMAALEALNETPAAEASAARLSRRSTIWVAPTRPVAARTPPPVCGSSAAPAR